MLVEEVGRGGDPGLERQRLGFHHDDIPGGVARPDGHLQTVAALSYLSHVSGATEKGDPSSADPHQVVANNTTTGHVVHGHGTTITTAGAAVDKDHRDAEFCEPIEPGRVGAGRCDQQPLDALLEQGLDVEALAFVAISTVGHSDHACVRVSDVLDTRRHVGEEGIGCVRDDEANDRAAVRRQVPRRFVAERSDRSHRVPCRSILSTIGLPQEMDEPRVGTGGAPRT